MWDSVQAGLWTLAAFLTGWVCKQILDRTVAPRFWDWWARRSNKKALNRVQKISAEYKHEIMLRKEIDMVVAEAILIVVSTSMQTTMFLAFLVLTATAHSRNGGDDAWSNTGITLIIAQVLLVSFAVLGVHKASVFLRRSRERSTLRQHCYYRRRIAKILRSIGTSDIDIRRHMEALPLADVFKDRAEKVENTDLT